MYWTTYRSFHRHIKRHLSNTGSISLPQKCAALSYKFPSGWHYHSPSGQAKYIDIIVLHHSSNKLNFKPVAFVCKPSLEYILLPPKPPPHPLLAYTSAMAYQGCEPIPSMLHPTVRVKLLRHKTNHVTSLIKVWQ